MNASPEDKELIKIIGADLGVRAILVEKDWLAMRLIGVIIVKVSGFVYFLCFNCNQQCSSSFKEYFNTLCKYVTLICITAYPSSIHC